ncbi:MAG: two-component response regulator modulated diguanylate cyclase [Acidimicrobiales bacterium]|nr:two-component response regulator modulated diguanylate cyclase [Acidimicrobiales bacterium]
MAGTRKVAAVVLVAALAGLAMLAWWSMLAAERAAVRATDTGARNAAVASALAVGTLQRSGGELAGVVALTEQSAGLRLLVRDGAGRALAGDADPSARLIVADVPGTDLTVAVEVDDAGLGVGRFSHVITAAAFLVMACSVTMLVIVAGDRRRAHVEIDRLGKRWAEAAAADDQTGLGNRTRLLEDTAALIARGSRYGNSFGLALFELPGEPSDGLILAVSEMVTGQARGADLCYRVDGGRFVTVLPEQDETGVTLAADRIRRTITERLGQEIRTGVSSFSPWMPCSASDLLLRAELDLGTSALLGEDRSPYRAGLPTRTA